MKTVFLKLSIFIAIAFVCLSCGRKAPPRLPTYEPPPAPTELTAVQRYHPRQVALVWKYDKEGMSFVIERESDEHFIRIATVTEQHFIDSELDENLTYRYRVRGMSEEGVMGAAAATGEAGPVPGLAKPVDVSIDISGDMVKLMWSHSDDMPDAQFNIYRRAETGEYHLSPVNSEPVRGNVFEDEHIFDKTVYYSVRLLVPGDVTTEGPPSVEVKVKPEEYVPARVSGVGFAVTKEKVLLFWDENPEPWVRGYRVYRSGEDGSFRAIGTSRTPAFEDSEPLVSARSYRVSALGPVRDGPPSESIVVQPAEQP